jgi:hypothetical protein
VKKIPCLFLRDFADRRRPVLLRDVTPGCEWVLAGEGRASRKIDGTACLIRGGLLFTRYDAKKGKAPPPGWEACEPEPDPKTGHWPGWVPVTDAPEFKYHREALARLAAPADGTYELIGPKVNGGHEGVPDHVLVPHGASIVSPPRTWDGLRDWLTANPVEGVVFAHPDGRMAKIRRDDYGLPWPVAQRSSSP